MHLALPRPPADDEHGASSTLTGLLSHLDVVYGFALTLTGDRERAADLTEHVFQSVRDELWSTLGGHRLRDRLLARCVAEFVDDAASRAAWQPEGVTQPMIEPTSLAEMLRALPWRERAVIALVDQLELTYAAAAAVLGVEVAELRTILHRGRAVLFAAYRADSR